MPLKPQIQSLTRMLAEGDYFLIAIGALIGAITGTGAVGFAYVLDLVDHFVRGLERGGGFGVPWVWLIVMPVLGMAGTGVLVFFFAPEAKGHGVPQVMAALIKRGGVIPLQTGIIKVIASVLTVGGGGSAGTEGPIVQIGAVAGSVVGQKLKVDRQKMMTFVGCGAAAGISSIFNAPIAGVFFVLEILLRDFSIRTFTPIVVSSVLSAVTTQAWLGRNQAIFASEAELRDLQFHIMELPSFLLLGVVCGLVAVLFSKMLHLAEDIYEEIRIHPVIKPITGGILLGMLGVVFLMISREFHAAGEPAHVPAIYGNGYIVVRRLLDPASIGLNSEGGLPAGVAFLALLLGFKLIATSVTLGSGGSGGVFAPSLFFGAAAGAIVGTLLEKYQLLPSGSTPASYALVGMASVVAAGAHAPLTSILILFELTRHYSVVLPVMLSAVVATATAQLIARDSIYTAKLRREGVLFGSARDIVLLRQIAVSSVPRTPLPDEPVYPSDPLAKLISLHAHHNVPDFVVVDDRGKYLGMVTGADIRTALIDREAIPLLLVAELLRTDLPTINVQESLDTVMDKFSSNDVASLCLLDPASPDKPLAMITRAKVMRRYQEALEQS